MKPLLILTAGFGEGHNAAARNIHAAAEMIHGEGTSVTEDLFALASPRLNKISRAAYLRIINRHASVWSRFYAWIDKSQVLPKHLWFLRKEMAAFERLLAEHDPVAVCSTYPVYGFMADRLRAQGKLKVPFHNVVTDSISVNSLWTRPQCTSWHVPNEDTASAVEALGVSRTQIHKSGFPVQPFFSIEGKAMQPGDLSRAGIRPRVLYILNSGTKGAVETVRLLSQNTDWELTLAVGRDADLYKRLSALTKNRKAPTNLLRWTDQIPMLLCTHHAVISKAGGATTQEAIAARCPMIVNQIVPGQEEGNYELMRRCGSGALAHTPEEVLTHLQDGFKNAGELWSAWRNALANLSCPEAAFEIVKAILPELPATSPTLSKRDAINA